MQTRASMVRGFVLIEALIAAAILATGLLVLGQFQTKLIQTSSDSRSVSEAMYFAQTTLDALSTQEIDDDNGSSPLAVGNHELEDYQQLLDQLPFGSATPEGTSGTYAITWNVAAGNHYRLVSVTAARVGSDGQDDANVRVTLHGFVTPANFAVMNPGGEGAGPASIGDGEYIREAYDPAALPSGPGVVEQGDGVRIAPALDGEGQAITDNEGNPCRDIIDECSGDALRVCGTGYARISGNLWIDARTVDPLATWPGCGALNAMVRTQQADMGNRDIGVCTVFPKIEGLISEQGRTAARAATLIQVGNDTKYRMLGYSCYVANNWYGPINVRQAEGMADMDICGGNVAQTEAIAVNNYAGSVLSRNYIGFVADLDGPIEQDGVTYRYTGIRGSENAGEAEYGSLCEAAGQGPIDCVNDTRYTGLEYFVPGGHHFLLTQFDPPLDGLKTEDDPEDRSELRQARRLACGVGIVVNDELEPGAMAELTTTLGQANYRGSPFQINVGQSVCLTPDTCGAFPRMSGHMPNNTGTSDLYRVIWQLTGQDRESICYTMGYVGGGESYWCRMNNATLGLVRPASPTISFDPEQYYYSTRDNNQAPIMPMRAGEEDHLLTTEKYLDFTRMTFAMTGLPSYTITGTVVVDAAVDPQDLQASINSGATNVSRYDDFGPMVCPLVPVELNGHTNYAYTCTVPEGWMGSVRMNFADGYGICAGGTTSHVFGENEAVTEDVSGKDFALCEGLGVPSTSWDGNNIIWNAIAGATEYRVYRCTVSGNTSCSNHTYHSTVTSALSYTAGSSNGDTLCHRITAANATQESGPSINMCVHRHGGTYTYTEHP